MAAKNLTADSKPVWNYLWIGQDDWTCQDLITWHQLMKIKYGKPYADGTFLKAWDTIPAVSAQTDCRTFNAAFKNYFQSEKIYDGLFGIEGLIIRPIGAGFELVKDASNIIENIGDAASNTSSLLKYLVPILVVVLIIVAIYIILQNSKSIKFV